MPTKRIESVDMPFYQPRYTPDTTRLAALYSAMGRGLSDVSLRRGEITQRGIENLAHLFSRYGETRRATDAANADAARREKEREDDKKFTAERDRLERETRTEERYQDRKARENEIFAAQAIDDQRRAEAAEQRKTIEEEVKRLGGVLGPNGQIIMPPKPEPKPNPTQASLAERAAAGDKVAIEALRLMRPAPSPGASEPLVPIVGPDGITRYGTRAEARGQRVPAGSEKPSSGQQKRVLNFFNRAEQANKDIEAIEGNIQKYGLLEQGRMAWAPNFLQSQEGQLYNQAQRAFTEARLRKDSGAAIPPHEFESDRKTYFPQPGDSQETLQQKRRARATMLASLAFESGQALAEFLGDPDEAKAVINEYRTRGAAPKPTVDKVPTGALAPGQTVTIGGFQVTRKQ